MPFEDQFTSIPFDELKDHFNNKFEQFVDYFYTCPMLGSRCAQLHGFRKEDIAVVVGVFLNAGFRINPIISSINTVRDDGEKILRHFINLGNCLAMPIGLVRPIYTALYHAYQEAEPLAGLYLDLFEMYNTLRRIRCGVGDKPRVGDFSSNFEMCAEYLGFKISEDFRNDVFKALE